MEITSLISSRSAGSWISPFRYPPCPESSAVFTAYFEWFLVLLLRVGSGGRPRCSSGSSGRAPPSPPSCTAAAAAGPGSTILLHGISLIIPSCCELLRPSLLTVSVQTAAAAAMTNVCVLCTLQYGAAGRTGMGSRVRCELLETAEQLL